LIEDGRVTRNGTTKKPRQSFRSTGAFDLSGTAPEGAV
jgi:hypothetical protein